MRDHGSRAGWMLATSAIALASAAQAGETITYSYDGLGRLVGVERAGTVNNGLKAQYGYDAADNRTNVTVGTAGASPPPSSPPPASPPPSSPPPASPPPSSPPPSSPPPSTPPPPILSVRGGSADEGSDLQFTILRSGSAAGSVSVVYSTSNGTAAAGSDYQAASGTVTFLPGQPAVTVEVATFADGSAEPAETMILSLSAPTGGAVLEAGSAQATGTINPSSAPPPPGPPTPPMPEMSKPAPPGPDTNSPPLTPGDA